MGSVREVDLNDARPGWLDRLRHLAETLCAHPCWVAGTLTAIGAYLRLANLGAFDFRWDEDLYSLAAKAIVATGIPELPSGMVYLRGGPFLYLTAASVQAFGFSEVAMRLPAALFGIATIPLAYLFAARLFGNGAGLLVAALVTFSAWDIEFSRYARMYAPFEFFYLLTLLAIWRYRIVEQSFAGGLLCIGLALVTISVHEMGYLLAPAFLVPLVVRGTNPFRQPRQLVFPAIAAASTAAFYFLWERWISYHYNLAAIRAAESGPPADYHSSPLATIAGALYVPDQPLLTELAANIPLATAALIASALLAAAVFCWRQRGSLNAGSALLLMLVAVACALQLFNVALLAVLALAFLKPEGLAAFRRADLRFAIVLSGLLFAGWLALGLAFTQAAEASVPGALKTHVKQMLDYPRFYIFWGFAREYPLMFIPALLGGMWAFDRAARAAAERSSLYLLGMFAVPIVLNGLFRTDYALFRYNVPFGPLFFTFVALGLMHWREVLMAWNEPWLSFVRVRSSAWGTGALVAMILLTDTNPVRGWLVTQRGQAENPVLYELFDVDRALPDYRSAAEFVVAHAREEDKIVVFDCREIFNYLGRLDYCVLSRTYLSGDQLKQIYVENDVRRDIYLSTPMIMNRAELEGVLRAGPGTKWLIVSEEMLRYENNISDEIRDFIRESEAHVVHVGPRGTVRVYRF